MSICIIIDSKHVLENFYKTQALVVDVVEVDDTRNIYVSYFHDENGIIYEDSYKLIDYYSKGIYEGDVLNIYINPLNGDIVYLSYTVTYFFNFIAWIFIIISFVFLFIFIKYKNKRNKYMKHGKKIYAKIVGYKIVHNVVIGDDHPYKIKLEYEDIFGKKIQFISEQVLLQEVGFNGERYMAVYLLNKKDYSKYYVDTDDVKSKSEIIIY